MAAQSVKTPLPNQPGVILGQPPPGDPLVLRQSFVPPLGELSHGLLRAQLRRSVAVSAVPAAPLLDPRMIALFHIQIAASAATAVFVNRPESGGQQINSSVIRELRELTRNTALLRGGHSFWYLMPVAGARQLGQFADRTGKGVARSEPPH